MNCVNQNFIELLSLPFSSPSQTNMSKFVVLIFGCMGIFTRDARSCCFNILFKGCLNGLVHDMSLFGNARLGCEKIGNVGGERNKIIYLCAQQHSLNKDSKILKSESRFQKRANIVNRIPMPGRNVLLLLK